MGLCPTQSRCRPGLAPGPITTGCNCFARCWLSAFFSNTTVTEYGSRRKAGTTVVEAALLRRDLPWRGRRVDQVGGKLGVAHLSVVHRFLLHGAVAADAVGQRKDFD